MDAIDLEPIAGFEYIEAGVWEAYVEKSGTRISVRGPRPIDAMTQLARSLAEERWNLVRELATRPAARTP